MFVVTGDYVFRGGLVVPTLFAYDSRAIYTLQSGRYTDSKHSKKDYLGSRICLCLD